MEYGELSNQQRSKCGNVEYIIALLTTLFLTLQCSASFDIDTRRLDSCESKRQQCDWECSWLRLQARPSKSKLFS